MYLLAVLLILAEIQAISEAQERQENRCAVFTEHQYVQWGSEVQITCRCSSVSYGKTSWTVNNEPVDDHLSDSINSSHRVLSLKNFTYPSAVIQCHSWSGIVLDGTTIKTYTKPNNVSCLFLQPARPLGAFPKMVCHWEHNMTSPLPVNYTVKRTCHTAGQTDCRSEPGVTSCVFKDLPALTRTFSVIVNAKSSTWEVDSDTYSFNPYLIWVLAPPELQVTALSSKLLVTWNQANVIDNLIHCQVRYSQALDNGTEVHVVNMSTKKRKEMANVNIEGIQSCIVYSVSARCAMGRSPWGNWSQVQTVVSMLNPKTFKLNLWRKVIKQQQNGVREVKVMWTEIPRTCKEEYACYISAPRYTLGPASPVDVGAVCSRSSCSISVTPEAHVIRLSILQNNRKLVANETVYLPAIGETLPQVSGIQASARNGIIQVSWQAPRGNVSGYVVDWTYDGNTYFWKRSYHTDTKLFDLKDFQLYNITVTPVFHDKTGHGKEAPQLCSRSRVPQEVYISEAQPKGTRADVSWDIKAEDKCSTDIADFIVFYRQTDKNLLYNISVNCSQRTAVLENLKPSTKYRVYVMAKGDTGNISSTERHFETQKHDTVLVAVLSICAAVGVFLLTIVGVGLYSSFLGKIVPNPGLSSLASWSSQSHQKISPQFSQPSEGDTILVKVHPREFDSATDYLVPPCPGDASNGRSAGDYMEQTGSPTDGSSASAGEDGEWATEEAELSTADQAGLRVRDSQNDEDEDEDTPSQGYLEVLPLSQSSPYRSQNTALPPVPKRAKECRRVSGNKHNPTYVSLDMFREGPDGVKSSKFMFDVQV